MTNRVGSALATYLKRTLDLSSASFVLIEGIQTEVAEGLAASWSDDLPRLAVVSGAKARFGSNALEDVSGTGLRNTSGETGVVLVLCEGEQVPDRQSLNLFQTVSPSVLLETPEGIAILAQQEPSIDLDGPVRAVREAVNQAAIAVRPSVVALAAYFDGIASGEDILRSLPTLGAFQDHLAPGERVGATRVLDNFELVSRLSSDQFLKPGGFADLRRRCATVLARRPDLKLEDAHTLAAEVISRLQAGSREPLAMLDFDEAREIFEKRAQSLTETVQLEIEAYRSSLTPGSQAEGLPWSLYTQRADELQRRQLRREAAQELCDLDDSLQRLVFSRPTRSKLERLLRDKSVNGSSPSCPEAAIVRAAQQLGGLIDRVQLLSPPLPTAGTSNTRSGALRTLALACARHRLGGLFRAWRTAGGEIDGLLLRSATDDDLGDVESAFSDANLAGGGVLATVQLRLYDLDGNTVQVDWRPDLDDVAMLRAALFFSEAPALTLRAPLEPTLAEFVSYQNITVEAVTEPSLDPLAQQLSTLAQETLDNGLNPASLMAWTDAWSDVCGHAEAAGDTSYAQMLNLAGAVRCQESSAVALTAFNPLKAHWLAQYLEALWDLVNSAEEPETEMDPAHAVGTAMGIAGTTAAHWPAYVRLETRDRPLLPTEEGRVWSLYGGNTSHPDSRFAGGALGSVVAQLLKLQPEAAGHLKCLAWGPGAADLLVAEATRLIGRSVSGTTISRIEVFCIGDGGNGRPRPQTLANADETLQDNRESLQVRYVESLDAAEQQLLAGRLSKSPAVHLAVVTGLTKGGDLLQINTADVDPPGHDSEVLFAPRVGQRPKKDRLTLLMPPATPRSGLLWLRLQNAIEDSWPEPGEQLRVPELKTGTLDIAADLLAVHKLALWVATIDRYVTRDSLQAALERHQVAILHQERRLGGDSPLSLVISQDSGGSTDRAIGRSLRSAGIVKNSETAFTIGRDLREVANQGYGILALQAATSGAGINELVGHVVAFSLLANKTTPWPLPPGCRVLLISLDEYRHWFPHKRADLLAVALDTKDRGVHVATIEVKARRSDERDAAAGALDQLNQTLVATQWAAYPVQGSVHSRMWLNRIAEAAYAVARESRFRLSQDELLALEQFRLGKGSLEWAGVGLVFGPHVEARERTTRVDVAHDIVPVVIHSIPLTEELLAGATSTKLTDLRTVESERAPLESGRTRRRPEREQEADTESSNSSRHRKGSRDDVPSSSKKNAEPSKDVSGSDAVVHVEGTDSGSEKRGTSTGSLNNKEASSSSVDQGTFVAPLLGWDADTGEGVYWHAAGPGQTVLQNGHVEVWGSSGMGKTQFTMCLLAQISAHCGSKFGIGDFKNDYSTDTGFPEYSGAEFIDLWQGGAPYNPLALDSDDAKSVKSAVIEIRDTVDEAVKSMNVSMGHRQRRKLENALYKAYENALSEGRWPTLRTLDDLLDEDLLGVIGDLTHNDLFKSGPPLGDIIEDNVVFGLSKIPGNGQTTILAAGFILSALLLKIQGLPPVPNTIRYAIVVDEAHRIAPFRAVQTMIREGRSKGLAVVLATQGPSDLPEVVANNAQTKVCFGLPDATIAAQAARKLNPSDKRLPDRIRTLGKGEALVRFAGGEPRHVRMVQAYRDSGELSLPGLLAK
ncbi:ATP-binding protein [Gordonia sp. 4N]|uniref:ATP-binding protein n=1 Tax=Gordonia sp. 4N TaxID=2993508 RepID=UPI002248D288|nr:TraM recognition domain-containing protein [Gordonia sp. 4N]MCX2755962.1 TraM recognition domain-containing protein [Gordonia sp. 4N]